MKHYKNLLVVLLFTLALGSIIYLNEEYSKKEVDTLIKVYHNEITFENIPSIELNQAYKEITEEVDRRKRIANQIERLKKLEAERQAEEKRLKRLAEEKRKKTEEGKYASTWMTFEGTYYTAFCEEGCTGVTKTGYDVSNTIYYNGYRIIAADLSILPLYTLVEVVTPYEKFIAVVLDTGGAIVNMKTDILVASNGEAMEKGRHTIQIRVIQYNFK